MKRPRVPASDSRHREALEPLPKSATTSALNNRGWALCVADSGVMHTPVRARSDQSALLRPLSKSARDAHNRSVQPLSHSPPVKIRKADVARYVVGALASFVLLGVIGS